MSWRYKAHNFEATLDNGRGDNYLFIRTQEPWLETDGNVTVVGKVKRRP